MNTSDMAPRATHDTPGQSLAEAVAELRPLEAEATPAPWRREFDEGDVWPGIEAESFSVIVYSAKDDTNQGVQGRTPKEGLVNAALIAAMRNHLRTLLDGAARAAELEAENAKLRELLKPFADLARYFRFAADGDAFDLHPPRVSNVVRIKAGDLRRAADGLKAEKA